MTYSYYPGCTLKTKAKDLDRYGRLCAEALGITLEEIEEWQCCGAVYPLARDEIATRLSSIRTLMAARDRGQDLVTLCSACHHVLTRVNGDMRHDAEMRDKAMRYLQPAVPYAGETNVIHYLQLLRDRVGFDTLAQKVTAPLQGRKIGAYYGCLLLRPAGEMAFDDPENPSILEDFIRALGAEPVRYPMRNECCGGYVTVRDRNFAKERSEKVLESAREMGAEAVVTACPLCMYNLKENGAGVGLPVVYITELLAEALGLKE